MPLGFSNWGDAYQGQGVVACGQDVWGAIPGDGGTKRSGTSFATPIVAGVAALLLSLQLVRNEEPNPQEVRASILKTAVPCDGSPSADCARWLAGRLNIAAARESLVGRSAGKIEMQSRANLADDDPIEVGSGEKSDVETQATREEPMSEEQTASEAGSEQPPNAATGATLASSGGVTMASGSNRLPNNPTLVDARGIPTSRATSFILPSTISPADCGCESCAAANEPPALAYVLGEVGYDFGTEARRDSFVQQMAPANLNPLLPAELLRYLGDEPYAAANLIWTLNLDATVVYAVQPFGPYANVAYDRLREFLNGQLTQGVERVFIPGYVKGTVRLLNGQQVQLLHPEIRGMYSWNTTHLVAAVIGPVPTEAEAATLHFNRAAGIGNFLERVYYELRNPGTTSQERAMNYAATDAYRLDEVFHDAINRDLYVSGIDVVRSPICRPGSDCWDVMLTFFQPAKRLEQAKRVYRMTVDVSDVIPVTVGKVRHWDEY
jgi:cyanobactin maturation PatA/PatG family protease